MLLLLMVVGVSGAWAQTSYGKAEITKAPGSSTGWQTIKDQGDVKAWYNGTTDEFEHGAKEIGGKWYVKLSGDGFIKIRVAKNSVAAGDILRVETIDIYQNDDQQDLGFKVKGSNGVVTLKETDNALHTLDYTLKAADIDVDPDDANYDYIQFDRNDNRGCGYHSVEILRFTRQQTVLSGDDFKAWENIDGNTSTGNGAITNSIGSSVDAGGTVYGDGNVNYLNYVNVKGGSSAIMPDAKYLIIEGNSGVQLRILFNRIADGGSLQEQQLTIPSNGVLVFDISSYDTFHLNAIKIPWNGSTGNVVTAITVANSLPTYTVNVNRSNLPAKCDAWFTIGSDATQYREQQWVAEGTQVTFTMNSEDPHYSPAGFRKTGTSWSPSGDPGWMGYSATLTTTVRSEALGTSGEQWLSGDVSLNPEFTHYYFVKANAEDGGTATVSDANGHDMNKGYEGNTGSLTFTATPNNSLKTFAGWYNGDQLISNENPYNYGVYNNPDKNDLTLTAKFAEKFGVITDQELTHNISLGETLSLHVTAGDSKFTTVDLYEDAELHNKLGFVSYNNPYVFDPEVGVTKGDDPDKGTVLKRGVGTYYLVFRACKSGDGYNFTTDENSVVFTVNVGEKYANPIEADACGNVHTFWMHLLNAGDEHVTVTPEDGAAHVVTDNSGSYVSFKYENPINLQDLLGWGIGVSQNDAVLSVAFYNGETQIREYFNSPTNRTLSNELKNELEHVTEMRIGIAANSDIKIDYVQLRIERTEGIDPILELPTREEMTIGKDAKVFLHITNRGYWREYTDDTYTQTTNAHIPYEYGVHDYDLDPLEPGDYYFEVRDGNKCKLGHQHDSKRVRVHVKVLDMDMGYSINENRQLNGRDYWLFVPDAIANGTQKDVPVVFSLHGTNQDYKPGDNVNQDGSDNGVQNFNQLALDNNFIVVYPRGRNLNFTIGEKSGDGWQATGNDNDDSKFLRALADEIKKNFSVNENKFYLTGFSNGGMMAYSAANTLSDVFAAFASVNGAPYNEMHHQHNANRTVPFMHIHDWRDNIVPKNQFAPYIVDNMLARNGLPYETTPVSLDNGAVTKYSYQYGGKKPYIYYSINFEGEVTEENKRHIPSFTIDGKNSKEIVWDFFKNQELSLVTTPMQFEPDLANVTAEHLHGWTINSGKTILKYGESGGYKNHNNSYHSIQLKKGIHWLKFTPNNADKTKKVTVRLTRLGDLDKFNNFSTTDDFQLYSYNKVKGEDGYNAENEPVLIERTYTCGEAVSFLFSVQSNAGSEYMLEIEDGDGNANSGTTITDLTISAEGEESGKLVSATDNYHTNWYNPNMRTVAQWNFDNCDGFRFNPSLISSKYWTKSESAMGDVYTYNQPLKGTGSDLSDESAYAELFYDPEASVPVKVPVTAGLKFNTEAGGIKIETRKENGKQTKCYLILEDGVKMLIPYVVNSYRSDTGSDASPDINNKSWYENCIHHWKRDIVYFAMADGQDIWDCFRNDCIDDSNKRLFGSGGHDVASGHWFYKLDFRGNYGVPCIMQIIKEAKIERINIERNLTFSYYTEYISDYGQEFVKPKPATRVVGSPSGQKIANFTETATDGDYKDAIAFTYGGWLNSDGDSKYKSLDKDGNVTIIEDQWSDLSVFANNKAMTWDNMETPDTASIVPVASDGFPVISRLDNPARSEQLMVDGMTKYHPYSPGIYNDHNHDGSVDEINYVANKTPWTLPVRGGYLKFEPTLPGVLNVHMLQHAGDVYFIADEFGKPVTSGVYAKTGTDDNIIKKANSKGQFTESGEGYKLWSKSGNAASINSDYVKYIFNVYPGKTYYIFSNTWGLGMAGFYYEPFVQRNAEATTDYEREYGRIDVGVREIELSANDNFVYPTKDKYGKDIVADEILKSPTTTVKSDGENYDSYREYPIKYSNKAVKVTLKDRSFTKDKWSTICLPYSMNQVQVDKVFGKGTKLVLLRDIQDHNTDPDHCTNTTAHFIYHQHKDIIAGYPYFIRPAQNVTDPVTYAYFEDGGVPAPIVIDSKDEKYGEPGETPVSVAGYQFRGAYKNEFYRNGSYYMSTAGTLKELQNNSTTGTSVVDGKTYNGNYLKPYRVRLEYYGSAAANGVKAFVINENGEEEIDTELETAIEEVMLEDGIVNSDAAVYDMSGKKMANDGNLKNLSKGIYIVNGKKFVVR